MDIESQSAQILAYLREGNSLTPLEALHRFGCFRLGARIWDLKKEGHDIRTQMVDVGEGKRVARYYLAGQMTMFPQYRKENGPVVGVQRGRPDRSIEALKSIGILYQV